MSGHVSSICLLNHLSWTVPPPSDESLAKTFSAHVENDIATLHVAATPLLYFGSDLVNVHTQCTASDPCPRAKPSVHERFKKELV